MTQPYQIVRTKNELIDTYNILVDLGKISESTQFNHRSGMILRGMKNEMDSIAKANIILPEYKKFNKQKGELLLKHAKKDPKKKNRPITWKDDSGIEHFELNDEDAYNIEFEKLKKKFNKTLEKQEKITKDFNDDLNDKVTIELNYKIDINTVPNHGRTDNNPSGSYNMMMIMDLLEGDLIDDSDNGKRR